MALQSNNSFSTYDFYFLEKQNTSQARQANTCSQSTIKTLEEDLKFVQS